MSDHIPTLADLCSAIAEGRLSAVVDGSMYQVNALELRRYLNKLPSLPSFPTVSQDALTPPDSPEWSVSAKISVA
jgi:hypothetical protein